VVAATNGLNNTCGGTATATASSSSVSLAGGTVGINTSCAVSVDVTAAPTGSYVDNTGAITSTNAPSGTGASATLSVANAPTIVKQFSPSSIPANQPTVLTFTIANPNSGLVPPNSAVKLTGIGFTDALPSGLQITHPNSGGSSTCGGTLAVTATSLSLTGGSLAANTNCTITVDAAAANTGIYDNTTSAISANESGPGATSNTAELDVTQEPLPPTLDESFNPSQVNPGDSSTITFDVANPNATTELDSITFQDFLPSGLQIATPNGVTGTCVDDGAQIRADAGSGSLRLLSVDLAGADSCSFSVNVTVAGPSVLANTTAQIAGSFDNGAGVFDTVDGSAATASITVQNPVTVTQGFSAATIPLAQQATLTFTLTNPATGAVNGIELTDTLTSGLAIASPNALTSTCSGATTTADPGTGSISLSGVNLAGNSSCTFSVAVTGTAQGTQTSSSTAPTTNGQTNSNAASASITVGPPLNTFTVANVTANANGTVTFNVTVPGPGTVGAYETAPKREFAIIPDDGPGAPSAGRFEFASAAQSIGASGTTAITVTPTEKGAQLIAHHKSRVTINLYVTYTPTGGTPSTQNFLAIAFPGPKSTVPSNHFSILSTTAAANGKLTFTVKLPDAGKLSTVVTIGGHGFAKASATAKGGGKLQLTVAPGSKGAKLIAKNAKKKHPRKLKLSLSVKFTPTGGYANTKRVGEIPVPAQTAKKP
jgi:hypothetical protein